MDKTGPTLGGVKIAQPSSLSQQSPIMDSDFYLFNKEQKVFISIDNLDKLMLAQKHLENSEKRFSNEKSARRDSEPPKVITLLPQI